MTLTIEGTYPPAKSVKLSRSLLCTGGSLEVQTHQYRQSGFTLIYYAVSFPYIMTPFTFICIIMWGLFTISNLEEIGIACQQSLHDPHVSHKELRSTGSIRRKAQLCPTMSHSLKETCSNMFCRQLDSEGIV